MRETFQKMGLRVVSWSLLARAGQSPRRTWKLSLQDGEMVKLRRLLSVERAEEVQVHLDSLKVPGYPRVLARHQDYLVEPWIDGQSLESPGEGQVVKAAALLRTLHQSAPREERATDSWRRHVQDLLRAHPEEDGEAAREALQALPDTMTVGLVHKDFCGSNLIQAPGGELWSIDNEWLSRDCIEFDLARSLYLWQLPSELEDVFLKAYGASHPSGFWCLAARLRSLRNRAKEGLGD